jgi:hypothetical protein
MEPRIPRYVPVVNVVLKFLTRRGTPEGFAAAVPNVAVFDVTPAGA